jgi:hypothetical protein
MYSIANGNIRQQLECDEARRLEGRIASLYKEASGRSRGWVKTKLEAYFLPRAAVGSRVYAKDVFDWSKIWEKEGSAILDFLCLAKGIRLAVWREADKVIGIWPAADNGDLPLYHVSSGGILLGTRNILQPGWRLQAPYSVEHALEKLSLEELDNVAEKLSVVLPAKKAEKVRKLAETRMRMRFV